MKPLSVSYWPKLKARRPSRSQPSSLHTAVSALSGTNTLDYAAEEATNELWVAASLEQGGGRLEVREKMNGPPLPRQWSLRQSSEDLGSIPDEGLRGGGSFIRCMCCCFFEMVHGIMMIITNLPHDNIWAATPLMQSSTTKSYGSTPDGVGRQQQDWPPIHWRRSVHHGKLDGYPHRILRCHRRSTPTGPGWWSVWSPSQFQSAVGVVGEPESMLVLCDLSLAHLSPMLAKLGIMHEGIWERLHSCQRRWWIGRWDRRC